MTNTRKEFELTPIDKDKRIAELERKLEQTEKDLTDYQFNYPKIKDLEKENAELKKRNGELAGQKASLERWFGEAKRIIRQLLLLPYANNEEVYSDVTSVLDKAEQFLKE